MSQNITLRKFQEKVDLQELSKIWQISKEELTKDTLVCTLKNKIIGGVIYKTLNDYYEVDKYSGNLDCYKTIINFFKEKATTGIKKRSVIFLVPDDDKIDIMLPLLKKEGFSVKLKPNKDSSDTWICSWSCNE